jgi:adhesin HecA-like repeat protein
MMVDMKQILTLTVLSIFVLVSATQNATALTMMTGKATCESTPINGVWTLLTHTCTVTTLVIGSADELIISSDIILNVKTLTSSGIIINNGQIHIASDGVITTSGKLDNYGTIAIGVGTITNSGQFENIGKIDSSGIITNGPTGVLSIVGSIISSGVIASSGNMTIADTGILVNNGIVVNTSDLLNRGTIVTSGTFTNSGPVMNMGDIWNSDLIVNNNAITNSGNIFNLCGGTITDSGMIFINSVNPCVSLA